jgi:hypothetical protein
MWNVRSSAVRCVPRTEIDIRFADAEFREL